MGAVGTVGTGPTGPARPPARPLSGRELSRRGAGKEPRRLCGPEPDRSLLAAAERVRVLAEEVGWAAAGGGPGRAEPITGGVGGWP